MNTDPKENTNTSNELSHLSAELLLWPGNQFCIIEGNLEEDNPNPSNFKGMCNGFMNDYELGLIRGALSLCNDSLSPIDPSLPLVVSTHTQILDKGNGQKSTILFIDCGVFKDGEYELTASGFEGNDVIIPYLSSGKCGQKIPRNDDYRVKNLFKVVNGVLKYRMNRISKVDFKVGG